MERIKKEYSDFYGDESGNNTNLESLKQIEIYLISELKTQKEQLKEEEQEEKKQLEQEEREEKKQSKNKGKEKEKNDDSDEGKGGPSTPGISSGSTSNENLPESFTESNFRSYAKNVLLFIYCQLVEIINFISDFLSFF